ncbi:abc transporter [Lucifera butyrica]|uniref:Abc transporter n=1 Tax=Lucifera butyrica TaxID=1351585 RepID=A0A498R1I6_9FIRM|nr:thiol reductant ABC exporter subunit CydD [Lucifera butyrica]VBB05015.1 abc transporter [Lucifera butyrica]
MAMLNKNLVREALSRRPLLLLLAVLSLGSGFLIVLQAHFLARIIDAVFLAGMDLYGVRQWLTLLFIITLARGLFLWLGEFIAQTLAISLEEKIRNRLVAHLLALGPPYLAGEEAGQTVNLLTEGVENLEPYFARYLPQLIAAALVPVLIAGFIFPLDVVSSLILLATAPLIPLFMILIGRLADEKNSRQWQALARLSAHFLDVMQGLTTLKLFGRSKEQITVIARMSAEFRDATLDVLKIAFLSSLVLELFATISTALVAVAVGIRLLYGHLSFYQAFFVLLLAPEFYLPLRQLGSHFHAGMNAKAAGDAIYALLNRLPQITGPAAGGRSVAFSDIEIELQQVSFTYPGGRSPALDGVSFVIEQGKITALVGPSGAGKSTVAGLLLGFIAAGSGKVVVNGMDLRNLDMASWRRHLAFVPQQPYLFAASVRDNIALGRPGASLEKVAAAARLAGAHEFIRQLPEGYDTLVGEGNRPLSGGETQRLAIARAFLQDAPLLIFDEATTGLDPANEAAVEQAMKRLMAGRTVLVIAHRLSTVFRSDRIIVLNEGRVAEWGSHAQLVRQKGLYSRMVGAYRGEDEL